MADEMDLLSGLKVVEPVRPHAFDEARAVLRAAMAVEAGAQETQATPRRRVRWGARRTASLGAVAVGAAAAAVALVVTSTGAAVHSTTVSATPGAVNPVLAQLASDVKVQQVKLPGDATMEIRNQLPNSDQVGANGVDLYTDSGTYYWAASKGLLPQVIAQGQDASQGQYKRDVAAALYAVNGDISTARARMSVANLAPGEQGNAAKSEQMMIAGTKLFDKVHHIKYTPPKLPKSLTPAQKQEQTDNLIWMNATDALTAEPENPQVRAGVLRLMATMPNVKVAHTSTAGQPTLTLSDSWPLLGQPAIVESMVINASTGFPVAMFNRQSGQPLNVTYYHVSRVTLADVAAGKS